MIKWVLNKWFYISIDRRRIDSKYILDLALAHGNSLTFWKKKYSFLKLVYCSERFKETYGAEEYGELVAFLFREFDEEEARIRAKIDAINAEAVSTLIKYKQERRELVG